jgi:two-component system response regulator PilR (NtrC family)
MPQQRVLIIDDEPDIRELLEITLLRMGLETYTAGTVQDALLSIQENTPNLCLTDMKLPDGTGIDVVNYIERNYPQIPVAVITAYGSMETAVKALKAGAYDFVSKPVDLQKLRELVETALTLSQEETSQNNTSQASEKPEAEEIILGQSAAISKMKNTIKKLSRSQAPVYIHGESGSGKELVAKQIHALGPRRSQPFIPVNCGAIPENLMESEFFGHKKGSFTGALNDKEGLFQAANHGTLFLDEVADLPLDMQVKLLRAIQEKAVKPVGGTEEISVDIRILSATHKSLEDQVANNKFRQDLYYRLNVIKLDVPPLRKRDHDILLLADFFLRKITEHWQMEEITLSDTAKQALMHYSFPGNVRELENILERASTLCENNIITPADLQLPSNPAIQSTTAPEATNPTPSITPKAWEKGMINPVDEQGLILKALGQTRWNRTKAAELLGMSFRQLRYRIKKYGLDKMEETV